MIKCSCILIYIPIYLYRGYPKKSFFYYKYKVKIIIIVALIFRVLFLGLVCPTEALTLEMEAALFFTILIAMAMNQISALVHQVVGTLPIVCMEKTLV